MSASLQELKSALPIVVNMIHPGWVPTVFSFMRSDPGGEDQEPHKDYQPSDLERAQAVHPGDIPTSMIFALQPATKIRIYTCCFDARDESKATVVSVPVGLRVLFEVT
ncbi:hypothetical protein PC121_g15180 [Phytophthora cactorum]|nr:hypothetical protein PC121_g15180 [Phytophthora cactorum]